MYLNHVRIEDTFAEAFPMCAARLVVTADCEEWAIIAARAAAGLAHSIVGCNCEADLAGSIAPAQTHDGRPGVAVLLLTTSKEAMQQELLKRIGQGVLPTPTSACYNGLDSVETITVGGKIRYFGDGYQSSKFLDGRRFWRVPVADGEFVVEESFGVTQGVGGGNLLIQAASQSIALEAAQSAVTAIRNTPNAIAPFPGGVCRSPSKIGSRYKTVIASTNHPFCPTLRAQVESQLEPAVQAVYEIVINGLSESAVRQAMKAAMIAACLPGVIAITAGNYGGKLGPYHLHLHQILTE